MGRRRALLDQLDHSAGDPPTGRAGRLGTEIVDPGMHHHCPADDVIVVSRSDGPEVGCHGQGGGSILTYIKVGHIAKVERFPAPLAVILFGRVPVPARGRPVGSTAIADLVDVDCVKLSPASEKFSAPPTVIVPPPDASRRPFTARPPVVVRF